MTAVTLDPKNPDLSGVVRPNDAIVWSQGTGEPLTLTEALVAQRAALGPVSVFLGAAFSDTLQPAHADFILMTGFGAIGTNRRLVKAGIFGLIPCHVSQIIPYINQGLIGCDVAFVQVSRAGPDGRHSYGVTYDYIRDAVAKARTVVAEINDQVPWTFGAETLGPDDIDFLVESSRPLLKLGTPDAGPVERAIAANAAAYIGDGAVLQVGIGAIVDAIVQCLSDRRDLGVHSGMVGDALVGLVESGALTNALKPIDQGVSITGALMGTEKLYRFADQNPAIGMRPTSYTTAEAVLSRLPGLVTINAAIEVDLTGQINAEQTGDDYIGAVGGHADYVRAGHRVDGGRSIIVLPSTALKGTVSRIRCRLAGGVTTSRSDADVVVTEHGVAELRAQPMAERARRLIAIAHPDFQETLERDAFDLLKRGF